VYLKIFERKILFSKYDGFRVIFSTALQRVFHLYVVCVPYKQFSLQSTFNHIFTFHNMHGLMRYGCSL